MNEELKPYFLKKMKESVLESGCLLWGILVIILIKLQSRILQSLHANHPGISRMKAIAQSYFWCNGLDHAIEIRAKSCLARQAVKPVLPVALLNPWVWPEALWSKFIYISLGHLWGKCFDSDRSPF